MKKINGLILSAVTAAFLVGCGGGGGSSASGDAGTTPTASGTTTSGTTITEAGVTAITYDRGAVYGATITDANGIPAKDVGTNVYYFVGEFTYPIKAKGGKVDTDGDGLVDETLPTTFEYTSNSEVITPITNYLSAFSGEELTVKLEKLKEITGLTPEEMKTKVSKDITDETKLKSFNGLKNALFKTAIDSDTSNDDITTTVFENTFKDIKEKTEKEVFTELKKDTSAKYNFVEISKEDAEKFKNDSGTSSSKLKVADLGRFVSYETGENWYDENTLSGDKLAFKPYSYNYNSDTSKTEWILDEGDGYVTISKDATDPYKFTYVDPITKEEGIFKIISTIKLGNYTDLSKSTVKIEVTKEASELQWDRWNWTPTYYNGTTSAPITDINTLIKGFASEYSSMSIGFNNVSVYLNTDGTIVNSVLSGPHYVKGTTKVGTWKQDGDQIVATVGKETKYLRVVSETGKYYIEQSERNAVGYIDSETIYTGSSLDDLIANIKAPAPVFTSLYMSTATENQTTTTYKAAATPGNSSLKVTYSISYGDANYFNIDSSTGVLTFKTAPNSESKSSYYLNVIATDSFGKTSQQYVIVNVTKSTTSIETPTTNSFVSGDTFKGLVYNVIASPVTGKQWLDRNLGATQACTSSTDSACYGDYYQWGRLADGHEKVNSATTTTKATNITNEGNLFVTVMGDWTTVDSDGSLRSALWSKTDGTGICPVGFRVPTLEEVTAENITSDKEAFDNLKFPVAGARNLNTGILDGNDVWADVWTSSSSTNSGKSYYINIEGTEVNKDFEYRADGRSVRCIKN